MTDGQATLEIRRRLNGTNNARKNKASYTPERRAARAELAGLLADIHRAVGGRGAPGQGGRPTVEVVRAACKRFDAAFPTVHACAPLHP